MPTPDSIVPTEENISTSLSGQHAAETESSSVPKVGKVIYTAMVHSTGGRSGGSRSSDGHLEVKLSIPGTHGSGTNPEQLFAAGWSACFLSAMQIAARQMGIALPAEATVNAEIDLRNSGNDYSLAARLNINLPGVSPEIARDLADAGDRTCPYSKAVRNNIDVTINLA